MLRWQTFIAMFASGLIWNSTARADQSFDTVQLICAPNIQYFSAGRHYVDDLNPPALQRSELFAVVAPESLATQQFDCAWRDHRIEVRAYKVDLQNPRGACPWEYGDSVENTLDGQHVDCLEGADSKFDDHRASLTLVEEGIPIPRLGVFQLEHCSADSKNLPYGEYSYRCKTNIIPKR